MGIRSLTCTGVATLTVAWCLLWTPAAQAQLGWTALAPFMDPRTGGGGIEGSAVSIIGSTIYVSKGFRPGDSPFLSSYDIPSGIWTHGGPSLPDAMVPVSEGGGGTALGKHYSIGGRPGVPGTGDVVEQFTPGGGWMTMSPMPTPRRGIGVGSLGGKIYVAGGSDGGSPGSGTPLAAFQKFDPSVGVGGTWTPLASMPIATMDAEATIALPPAASGSVAGKVYVFGGITGAGITGAVQIYDIFTDSWAMGVPMPIARSNAMAGFISQGVLEDGKIVVYGGYDGVANTTATEFYDPITGIWTIGPAMLFPQSEQGVGVAWDGSGVYAIGSGIFGVAGTFVERLSSVPEPGTIALIGLTVGASAYCLWRKRRQRLKMMDEMVDESIS